MKRFYTLFIYIIVAFSATHAAASMPADSLVATTLAERLLVGVPYDVTPALSPENRHELISMHRISPQDTVSVKTALGNDIRMLQCSDQGFTLQLSQMSFIQVLPVVDGADTTICVVTTTGDESVVAMYSKEWKLRDRSLLAFSPEMFLCDTLTASQRAEVLSYVEFPLYAVRSVEITDGQLLFDVELTVPLLTEEDKNKLKGAFLLRRLKFSELFVNK